jgi:hypothetical protein
VTGNPATRQQVDGTSRPLQRLRDKRGGFSLLGSTEVIARSFNCSCCAKLLLGNGMSTGVLWAPVGLRGHRDVLEDESANYIVVLRTERLASGADVTRERCEIVGSMWTLLVRVSRRRRR